MMPSPVYWLMVPSKRCTPSARMVKKRSRMPCHVSGSTRPASSIEPCTSANSTVTCLRSPSSALRSVRMRSARCGGVYARGSRSGTVGRGSIGAPQPSQKRAPPGRTRLQRAQVSARREPQLAQKPASSRFSWPQDGQGIAVRLRYDARGGRYKRSDVGRATVGSRERQGHPERAARARRRSRP